MTPLFRLCLCLSLLLITCRLRAEDQIHVAFWNVENLFDTRDDPLVELDEEFTPTGPKEWSDERLQIKLQNLARVLKDMNEKRGPDVLGLAEIENRTVLELLVKEVSALKRDYRIVHQDSPSGRGIDCALLYDAHRLKLVSHQFHAIPMVTTRDIVEAELQCGSATFHLFVNHWPSQGNPEEDRITTAGVLRKRVDDLLANDPEADFLIMGDLNEPPVDPAVSKTLRTWGTADSLRPGVLFNSMWPVHQAGRGTYVYRNKWNLLDHVILSPGLLDDRGLSWVKGSTEVVQFDYQMFVSRTAGSIPRPSRSYSGPNFHRDGYSDHLPVACRIRVQSP